MEYISGREAALGIKTDGTLWAWGLNSYGHFGNGNNTDSYIPIQIGNDTNWQKVLSTSVSTIAMKTDGTLWAWGYNSFGGVGNGTNINSTIPIQIGIATNWESFSGNDLSFSAINSNDELWSWGRNQFGQLGINSFDDSNVPILVSCSNPLTNNTFTSSSEFSIFPNPAYKILNIQNSDNKIVEQIKIIDLSGKTVLEQKPISNQIDVEKLQSGIYIIQIMSDGKSNVQKFSKQ